MKFDPSVYWNDRHERTSGLSGVGFLGLRGLNDWMYRLRKRVFRRTVRRTEIDPRSSRVLDVGSGTGFYLDRWRELGAKTLVGSDFSNIAHERLQAAYPDIEIVVLDITTTDPTTLDGLGQFDLISVMDVLYHVVDDDAYARAFNNLERLLAPGGRLIFTENFLHRPSTVNNAWHRSRELFQIERQVGAAGLKIVERRPWFVLMNDPVDSESQLHERAWWMMRKLSEKVPGAGYALGAALYPAEVVLTRVLSESPTSEIATVQRA